MINPGQTGGGWRASSDIEIVDRPKCHTINKLNLPTESSHSEVLSGVPELAPFKSHGNSCQGNSEPLLSKVSHKDRLFTTRVVGKLDILAEGRKVDSPSHPCERKEPNKERREEG